MLPANHVQSRVCHIAVLANAGSLPRSESNRMLTAVDLSAIGVIVNKQFLKVTYSPFKYSETYVFKLLQVCVSDVDWCCRCG